MIDWIKCTEIIERGADSSQIDEVYMNLCLLVGTMLSQTYLLYPEMNMETIQAIAVIENNESMQ